jgi:hypothetical protein
VSRPNHVRVTSVTPSGFHLEWCVQMRMVLLARGSTCAEVVQCVRDRAFSCTLAMVAGARTLSLRSCRMEPFFLMGNTIKEYVIQFVADRKVKGKKQLSVVAPLFFARTRSRGRMCPLPLCVRIGCVDAVDLCVRLSNVSVSVHLRLFACLPFHACACHPLRFLGCAVHGVSQGFRIEKLPYRIVHKGDVPFLFVGNLMADEDHRDVIVTAVSLETGLPGAPSEPLPVVRTAGTTLPFPGPHRVP